MGSKRISQDGHKLTNVELQRRFQDKAASIDKEMDDAFSQIDWKRRKEAEKSLVKWVNTYCLGLLLDDSPPDKGNEILEKMEEAITSHKNYMILMARGQGKSSYVECTALFAMAVGLQKYTVIISNNARASAGMLNDIWRVITETDTPFAYDYPEVCKPYQMLNGSLRRRQIYNGHTTDLKKTSDTMVFPTMIAKDGTSFKTSGSVIAVRGISGGIRGMKKGTLRPTLVLLDDLQTFDTAQNADQIEKLMNLLKKDIMALGGKERLSILQTATPIAPDDYVEQLKNDTNWITQVYPAIISYPDNMTLWDEYFKLYDDENVNETDHSKSLEFYREHFKEMNKGAEVFNPKRFSEKDGHISAIQKMLEFKHIVGESAFASECQMKPQQYSFSLEIKAKDVVRKQIDIDEGAVPEGYLYVVASSDLNLSYCISTTIVGFKPDMTAHVIKHIFRKCRIDGKLPDAEYQQKVYKVLSEHGKELQRLGLRINAWSVDCNGVPFNAVTSFCKSSMSICGIPSCGFIGKASHLFNGQVRSRLKNEIGRTVLCGDPEEHVKSGAGKKYVFWDSDYYRELVQKSFLAEIGSTGSLTIYKGTEGEHTDYATQICSEKLKFIKHRQDGRNEYYWKSTNDHDMLDSTAQAYACVAQLGVCSTNFRADGQDNRARAIALLQQSRQKSRKKKFKFV